MSTKNLPGNFDQEIPVLVDSLMRRISTGLHAKAAVEDTAKIGPMGGMLLMLLAEKKELSLHNIVDELKRDKAQLSKKICELEGKSLMSRRPSRSDKRVVYFNLTDEGHDYACNLRCWFGEVLNEILSSFDDHDYAQFLTLLRKIYATQV